MSIYVAGLSEQQVKFLKARGDFVAAYCARRGWNAGDLSIEQILEIRREPGWKNPKVD